MFDKIILAPGRTRTEYVTREVHEHRAPTDESVKLLREMEQKARDQVIEAIMKSAKTGKVGDGKIFITEIERVIRIRTGETDDSAL